MEFRFPRLHWKVEFFDLARMSRLGWTALLEAIILGDGGPRHTEVVRLLVESRVDVNVADASGVTPVTHARQRGYPRRSK